jgi:hypothetical protein
VQPDFDNRRRTSANSNLAAALTLTREEGGPGLAFRLLEAPTLDLPTASR